MSNNSEKRVVVTGMGINTPIGDTLGTYWENLIAGKSAITRWKQLDTSRIYAKVGGDLSDYDVKRKLKQLEDKLDPAAHKRLRRLIKRAPFSTRLAMLCAADAYIDAGLDTTLDSTQAGVIVGGHNLHNNLVFDNHVQFDEEPEYIDSLLALHSLDTDEATSVGEVLQLKGPVYTVGGACASVNVALRSALDEIRYHGNNLVMVVGAPLDFAPLDLQAMAIMGAISYQSFNDDPERASRPYDTAREGFIPSHGAGVMVIEELRHAQDRGARIYAEICGVATASDGNHLPAPSAEGQTRTITKLLQKTGTAPEEVDYINAHATSTPLGDVTEINSIKQVFGDHAGKIKINATKSMLGHTCWSAPVVETIASILQMGAGKLHPSINIENMDPEVDLDIVTEPVDHEMRCFVKNSFGFGGINCCALYKRFEA